MQDTAVWMKNQHSKSVIVMTAQLILMLQKYGLSVTEGHDQQQFTMEVIMLMSAGYKIKELEAKGE